MRTRTGLAMAVVMALAACHRSSSELSLEGRRMEIAGDVQKEDAVPGFTFEVILDGTRLPVGGNTKTESSHYYVGIPTGADLAGRHRLELRITGQGTSPSTYHVWDWYVRAFDLAEPRSLGSADLREQRVAVATGETIRWDFDL